MTLSTYPISNGLPAFNLGPSFLEYAIQREMKMASIKENLIAAKALIDTPEKWAQGSYHSGGFHGCDRHCTLGAIMLATPDFDARDAIGEALRAQLTPAQRRVGHCIATFNDTHTHAEVMNLFDRAITAQDEVA